MKHLFQFGDRVGAFARVVSIDASPDVLPLIKNARHFAVRMVDGERLVSESYALADFAAAVQRFVAAWDAALAGGSAALPSPATLQVKRLRPDVKLPVRSSESASCFDVHAAEAGCVPAGQWALVKTGLSVAVPRGYEVQVRSRSGHAAKAGVFVLNSPGTVDADYRGEVGVILKNDSTKNFVYAAGDRIAQMAVCAVEMCPAVEVATLDDTKRGTGGFGSTGT